MQSVKEKMSNVGAKVQEKVEEGKASAQEKYEKMTAHDKAEKKMAHEKKEARQEEAKRMEHEKRAENAAQTATHSHGHKHQLGHEGPPGTGAFGHSEQGGISHPVTVTPGTTNLHSSNPPTSHTNYVNTPHPMSTTTPTPNYPPKS